MSDTKTQIRDYYEGMVVQVAAEEILDPTLPLAPLRKDRIPKRTALLVAAGTAVIVVVVIGAAALLFSTAGQGSDPASPSSTVVTTTTVGTTTTVLEPVIKPLETFVVPDAGLGDVPAFEATVRYELGGRDGSAPGSMADVLVSYDPPDSFRREIMALDPPEMEFAYGEIGDYVATDGAFPIFTGETTEEGEELGPLVWFNWEDACTQPAEAVATETVGSVILTVVRCEAADSQWVAAGTPWTIRVDASTGIVFQVQAELDGGEFRIPGGRMEILSIDYAPEFAAGYFAPPMPDPPPIPGEPFAFTYTIDDGRKVAVSWLDDNTWRWDYIVGGGSGLGSGSYQIYADGTLYTYSTVNNEFWEERFAAFEGRGALVEWVCDGVSVCENAYDTNEGNMLICEVSEGGRVATRTVTRYDCGPTTWFPEQTFWIDNELGYILKSSGWFEVLTVDLAPSLAPGLFDQKCATLDCSPAPTE